MIRSGKRSVLGVQVDVVDYDGAVESILEAARDGRSLSVTALAVHGLMLGVLDQEQRYRLNSLNLAVPDGQPVRWALNWLYRVGLKDRVYGPTLTLAVCEKAEREGLPVYFYGATPEILLRLKENLLRAFPRLIFAGTSSSKFRRLTLGEKKQVVTNIRKSGASMVFVGLGCPRQEVWAYEFRDTLSCPVIAVGAALPFLAGTVPQAPEWMQARGLEWLFRLRTEPGRLWKRYLLLNPIFLALLLLQVSGILRFRSGGKVPTQELLYG
jgi:N-acetylglucosaminyldiphosphoundecaprenol N-acetyl-beta-D-mannosaminyltransferase